MTPTEHPLATVRRSLLRHAATLERCRAEYQRRGMVDEALSMERMLDYFGEAARIAEQVIAATERDLAAAGGQGNG